MDTIGPITPVAFDVCSRKAVPIHDYYSLYSNVICVAGKDEIAELDLNCCSLLLDVCGEEVTHYLCFGSDLSHPPLIYQ
jgi:hypothetical protein